MCIRPPTPKLQPAPKKPKAPEAPPESPVQADLAEEEEVLLDDRKRAARSTLRIPAGFSGLSSIFKIPTAK